MTPKFCNKSTLSLHEHSVSLLGTWLTPFGGDGLGNRVHISGTVTSHSQTIDYLCPNYGIILLRTSRSSNGKSHFETSESTEVPACAFVARMSMLAGPEPTSSWLAVEKGDATPDFTPC